MTVEGVLFLLRVVSGVLLCAVLAILFLFLWRDLRTAALQTESRRRSYGLLIGLQSVNDILIPTGQTYPLLPLTTLGRAATNTIPLNDTFASGEHALIALRDGQWWLEDRASRNGTLLNGVPVTRPTIITGDDVIGIGALRFRVEFTQS